MLQANKNWLMDLCLFQKYLLPLSCWVWHSPPPAELEKQPTSRACISRQGRTRKHCHFAIGSGGPVTVPLGFEPGCSACRGLKLSEDGQSKEMLHYNRERDATLVRLKICRSAGMLLENKRYCQRLPVSHVVTWQKAANQATGHTG